MEAATYHASFFFFFMLTNRLAFKMCLKHLFSCSYELIKQLSTRVKLEFNLFIETIPWYTK